MTQCRAQPALCPGSQHHLQLCSQICHAHASDGELFFLICKTLCVGIRCDGDQQGALLQPVLTGGAPGLLPG